MKHGLTALGLAFGIFFASPAQAATWLCHVPAETAVGLVGRASGVSPTVRAVDDQERAQLVRDKNTVCQPNYSYHALFTPNDPQFAWQWNFQAVQAPAAWDVSAAGPFGGDPRIVVAVLDSGIAFEAAKGASPAPDLAGMHVWTNPNEIAGDGIDNDGNGYVDDVHGWNFIGNDQYPIDDNGHGTHIAGTIAGTTNNGIAVAGIAFSTTVMPLKVLDRDGNGSTTTIIAAINYAVAHGANIINLSLGGTSDDPLLHQAVQQAAAKGVILVAASGNDSAAAVNYPARYSEVIAVGAVQADLTRTTYSNAGPELGLVAPGGNVQVDQNNDGQPDGIPQQTCVTPACTTFDTYFYSGTSQAAAHVSAAAALLEACGAPVGNVTNILESTAADLGPAGRDPEYGFGLLNISAALAAAGCQSVAPAAPGPITATSSQKTTQVLAADKPYPYIHPSFAWTGPAGTMYQLTWGVVSGSTQTVKQTAASFRPALAKAGVYRLAVVSIDALGRTSPAVVFIYRYRPPAIIVSSSSSPAVALYQADGKKIRSFSAPAKSPVATMSSGALGSNASNQIVLSEGVTGAYLYITSTSGQVLRRWQPFGASYRGRLKAAVVRQGTETPMIVVATIDNGAELRWFTPDGRLVRKTVVYASYRGGLDIAGGDINSDGQDELVVGQTNGPEIRVYAASGERLSVFRPKGQGYAFGWQVTTGDSDGNGTSEIVAVGRGQASVPVFVTTMRGVVKQAWTWRRGQAGNWSVQSFDVDGDGIAELLAGNQTSIGALQFWALNGKRKTDIRLASTTAGLILGRLE